MVLGLLPALVYAVGLWAAKRHQENRLHVAPVDAQRRSSAWWSDGRRGRFQPNQNEDASKPASVALMQVAKPPEPLVKLFFLSKNIGQKKVFITGSLVSARNDI